MLRLVRFVLVVLGILAVAAGVIYLVEPIHSLPSFFPGHSVLHGRQHHHIRGYVGIAVGVILFIVAAVMRSSRPRHY
jgi:hypothetical protein